MLTTDSQTACFHPSWVHSPGARCCWSLWHIALRLRLFSQSGFPQTCPPFPLLNIIWMAFDVPEYSSMTLACPGQQKMPGSGKCRMSPLQSWCQSRIKEQGSSRGSVLSVWKESNVPRVTVEHPQEKPVLLQSITWFVLLLSGLDRPSSAWICQICCTLAIQECTFLSVW